MCDDEESNRLNATALRRIDPTFTKLHGTASQVAVYRYNSVTQSWDKTDTVGCLFLYERNMPPKYGLVVMNRKNANNFLQKFGPDGQVVLHQPYLLLRSVEDLQNELADGTQAIHCIWFYEPQDCVKSANILRKMGLKFEGEMLDGQVGGPMQRWSFNDNAGQQAGNMLFQILQKGKKETPVAKDKIRGAKVITAEELESQMLHESSPQLKAPKQKQKSLKVANGKTPVSYRQAAAAGAAATPRSKPLNNSRQSPHNTLPQHLQQTPTNKGNSVLDQLMSMSIKETPEHVRKNGRGSIRGDDGLSGAAVAPKSTPSVVNKSFQSNTTVLPQQNQMRTVEQLERVMKRSDSSVVAIQNELMQTLGIPNLPAGTEKGEHENFQSSSSPFNHQQQQQQACNNVNAVVGRSMLDNIVGKSVDETDPEQLRQVLQSIEPSNLILVTENIPGVNETRLTWRLNRSSSLRKESESTFTTPTGEFVSASATRCNSEQGMGYYDGAAVVSQNLRPTPLTKDQLNQALLYLLQNDPDFVTKIHDGYIKSLQQAYDVRHC